jgi:hypothetical protein
MDGDVYAGGRKVGKVHEEGDVYAGGSKVGKVPSRCRVRREGDLPPVGLSRP